MGRLRRTGRSWRTERLVDKEIKEFTECIEYEKF
jgi:hypothetical protein